MKKFLTGILALSLLSIASVAFAQKVGICEQAGYTWSVEQGKCVPSSAEHPCNKDCVYSEEEGKCVCKQTNKMCKGNYVWNEKLRHHSPEAFCSPPDYPLQMCLRCVG